MITEKELTEYRSLCVTLGELHDRFLKRREELRLLLEKTAALKQKAFLVLFKANRLTRHLTGGQRYKTGLSYYLKEIEERINNAGPVVSPGFGSAGDDNDEAESLKLIRPGFKGELPVNCRNLRELKQWELLIIKMIDAVKKKLLQIDILELRCRELIQSINKALEAFRHESGIINRKIYPLGILSFFCRSLRRLFGGTYFSPGDLADLAALGSITVLVLKIADSLLI